MTIRPAERRRQSAKGKIAFPTTPSAYLGASIGASQYGGTNAGYNSPPPWNDAQHDASWNLYEGNIGRAVSILSYHLDLFVWTSSPADHGWSRGATTMLTTGLETTNAPGVTLNGIAAGTFNTQIDAWATSVAAWGRPFLLRPWWEMNGNWYAWGQAPAQTTGNTPTDYVNAWRLFRTRCDAKGATNITWCWCPNYWVPPGGSVVADPQPWWPGQAYVDWLGFDAYNKGGSSAAYGPMIQETYNRLIAIAPNKPIYICEWGSEEYSPSNTKPDWITAAFSALKNNFPKIKGATYYNENNGSAVDGTGATDTFAIESTGTSPTTGLPFRGPSLSSAAYKTACADSYWIGNILNTTTAPSAAKLPIPPYAASGAAATGVVLLNAEGGTDGVTPTTADTFVGDAPTAFNIGTGSVLTYSSTQKMHGAMAYRMGMHSATAAQNGFRHNVTPARTVCAGRLYFLTDTTTFTNNWYLLQFKDTINNHSMGQFVLGTGIALTSWDGANNFMATLQTGLSINHWYRLEYVVTANGATCAFQWWLYDGDSTTAINSGSFNAPNGGAASVTAFDQVFHGPGTFTNANSPSATGYVYYDDMITWASAAPGPV